MFVPIANIPRPYAWGSMTAIAGLLGSAASGGPEAELWLGAHPGSPSRILAPETLGGARDLVEWIAAESAAALGGLPRLPFLLKVLAADTPLSLQAHPTAEQAQAGFARENALGIPLDAPYRNYRDAYPKPEIIVALSEKFEALCGFRPVEQTREVFEGLGLEELVPRLASLPELFEWLMTRGAGVEELIARVEGLVGGRLGAAESPGEGLPAVVSTAGRTNLKENGPESVVFGIQAPQSGANPFVLGAASTIVSDALDTVRRLSAAYPGDAGILAALLLNRVTLARGEALYLPAGNIHAYLSGLGIELMTASDNVLRGGLTPKHVDVPELMRVLDFTAGPVPYLEPDVRSASLEVYRPGVADFALAHVRGEASYDLTGPAIALCTAGSFTIEGAGSSTTVERGSAVYVTPDEARLSFVGAGELFLAATD